MKLMLFFVYFLFFGSSSDLILAQGEVISQVDVQIGQGYIEDLDVVISNSINLIFVVAALLAFAFLIAGGLRWIISGGDKSKIEGARDQIIAAVVGLLILASSWAIINFSLNLLGLEDLENLLKNIPQFK